VHAISAYASRPRQGELPDAHIDDGDTVQTSSNRNLGRYRMQEEDHAEKIQELEKCLRTGAGVPPAELLIRTSGETRLSNFMLWQSSRALLLFLRTLWPALSYLHLLYAIIRYQKAKAYLR